MTWMRVDGLFARVKQHCIDKALLQKSEFCESTIDHCSRFWRIETRPKNKIVQLKQLGKQTKERQTEIPVVFEIILQQRIYD